MRSIIAVLFFVAVLSGSPNLSAQEPIDLAMIARIREEGSERSQAQALFHTLTDAIGARLVGSPGYRESAAWARDRFSEWGLANSHLETVPYPVRGWSLEKLSIEMTSPRYMPMIGYPEAWTPSTAGVVEGPVVYLGGKSPSEVEAILPQIRGKVVLASLPQISFVEEDRPQPGLDDAPVRTGNPPLVGVRGTVSSISPAFRAAGAGVVLRPGIFLDGTIGVAGNRTTPPDATPTIILAAEHYNILARLSESGIPVEMRIELRTRTEAEMPTSDNVIAEIPGVDPALREEIVIIGAHLDSWHVGTGATDNADGVIAVMEAARILAALDARPRRTIRFALWTAEELGFAGSMYHVSQHFPDQASRDRVSMYLNDDPGGGRTLGVYTEGNPAAREIFDAWLEPLRDLGVTRNIPEGIGATDHLVFRNVGIPGFTVIKDFEGYDSRTRHTTTDFSERTDEEELKQSAIFMAVFAWQAAMREEPIPRPAAP